MLAGRILRQRGAILHVNTSLNPRAFWRDTVYVWVAIALRRKVVYQIHGGNISSFCGSRPFAKLMLKQVLRKVDAVVVLYKAEETRARELCGQGAINVIQNALDLRDFSDAKTYSGNIGHLAYIGRLDRDKGLRDAIRAVAILRKRGGFDSLRFTIAGGGPAEAELRDLVRELALDDIVDFLGPIFGVDKSNLWRTADIFLLPSYHEGLPYSLLESLASGTPMVVTAVGAIPEVVTNGVHGILVAPGSADSIADAIAELLRDKNRLRQMSSACITLARQRFAIERLAQNLHELYSGVIAVSYRHGSDGRAE